MKIALIFSPFVENSYIPLGIAQLKSYIEQQVPSAAVYTLDLNNHYFNNLKEKVFLNKFVKLCAICPHKCRKIKEGMNDFFNHGKLFKTGIRCVKDIKSGAFYDIPQCDGFMSAISSFLAGRRNCLRAVAAEIIQKGLPIPPGFEDLFARDLKMIARLNPDVVGFSLFCSDQILYSVILARIVKEKLNLPVIFGGALMSHLDIREFLGFFDCVDFAIGGEGETAAVEFVRNFPAKTFGNVPGLYFRRKEKILFNPEKAVEDLDRLPAPDFSDFKLKQYLLPFPVLPLFFSRGCYWKKCTFCDYYKNHPGPYKTKSIEKFIAEIRYYYSRGIRHFFIDDDVISASNLNAISIALKRCRVKIFFGAIVRPEAGFSGRVLRNIYSAGGRVLIWGVESGCQRVLNLMNKGTRAVQIKKILKLSKESGFYNHLFMLQGFPTQTEEEMYADIKFLVQNRGFFNSFFIHDFVLLHGSRIFYDLKKYKINSVKSLPLLTNKKNNTALQSGVFAFEGGIELNWERIKRKEAGMLKKAHMRQYSPVSHAHSLLRASR